jgi:tRNA/tmRNA/rRNA uracil-C5-methylase (TrmA/RlmC/RlmD family)
MSRSKPNSQSPSSFATDPFLSQLPLLNLTIEKLVIGGAGLARIQSGSFQNMVIFIPFACPGDHVEVRITKKHKNHLEGRIERILVPGPSRRTPPCPHATDCGGCNWQHLTTDEQIKQKPPRFGLEFGNSKSVLTQSPQVFPVRKLVMVQEVH